MKFADPGMSIFAGAVVAGLTVFYVFAFRRRSRDLAVFAQEALWKDLLLSVDARMKWVKAGLLVSGAALCCIALMRPLGGFHWQEVKRKGVDIIIALDTSKSMLARDVKPDRLQRAKLAVRDMARYTSGDRLGLIAFSGTAFMESPLTIDYNGFLLALDALDVETIPRGGTAIAGAIREAMRSFNAAEKKYKAMVIISDGEDLEGDALKAAQEAKDKGIVIHCIGVGTQEGDLIPLSGGQGTDMYLKDSDGNVVKTRLQEQLLQKVALATGGSYIHATSKDFGLEVLYKEKICAMEKREYEGTLSKRYEDRFQIPLAAALFVLLLEVLLSDRRRTAGERL